MIYWKIRFNNSKKKKNEIKIYETKRDSEKLRHGILSVNNAKTNHTYRFFHDTLNPICKKNMKNNFSSWKLDTRSLVKC